VGKVVGDMGYGRNTIGRVWKQYLDQKMVSPEKVELSSKVAKRSGRKKELDINVIKEVDFSQRCTFRSLSEACGIPIGTLHREMQQGKLKRVRVGLKPLLTPSQKIAHIKHVISQVNKKQVVSHLSWM